MIATDNKYIVCRSKHFIVRYAAKLKTNKLYYIHPQYTDY